MARNPVRFKVTGLKDLDKKLEKAYQRQVRRYRRRQEEALGVPEEVRKNDRREDG